jgi:rhodanese-related sulfurtransferase
LDVRSPGEFMVGHIEGAINIDVENPAFESEIAKLDKSATYAVYCHSGRRSGIAVEAMHHDGFNNLFNLTNGIADWQANNFPVVTS